MIIYMFRTQRRIKKPVKHLRWSFFVNTVIDGKSLTIFGKSSILDLWDWGSEHASGISKVKCNLKVKFTFYAKVQGKVHTYGKMKKSKYCKKDGVFCEKWSGWIVVKVVLKRSEK